MPEIAPQIPAASDSHKLYRTFEDLEIYQAARNFRKSIYQAVQFLPETEKFGLVPQVRRAAVSLTNNIAKDYGRYHFLDKIKFMPIQDSPSDLEACAA